MAFAMLGTFLPGIIGTDTALSQWLLRAGLWLLGLIAAALVYFWLAAKAKSAPPSSKSNDEIDLNLNAARSRLAEARGKKEANFGRLPLFVVLGPPGASKTTLVTRSGLQPELLAGEVLRGDSVVSTPAANVWYAHGNVVVEAGAGLLNEPGRWRRLVQHIQPARLAAVMSKGQLAPRAAVVCFPCDEFLKPGASQSIPATAQRLRERLADIAQQVGIRLPVYVVFTKADRLPYFEDYVRSFTRDEAQDVLGATLPITPVGNVGHYAERESRRLAASFLTLFRGLALRRLDVLPRETPQVKAGIYEFPREFRKITDLATQFLIDVCRPSQLGVSPFLRGFYFTGVRPVVVHDVAVATPAMQVQVPAGGAVDATTVFDPRALLQQQSAVAHVSQPGSRRVPEWVFLERVFKEVILRDTAAQAVTAGGTRVTLGRRLVLGTAAAALIFFSLGMTWSLFANRALLGDTREAVNNSRSLALTGAMPELDALQRLDQLRQRAARLNRYQREGNPLGTSWALYAGNGAQPDVRHLYFRKFETLLWEPTRARLNGWLASLPATPDATSNYDATYDALKAHLVTTEFPDSARREFLAPVLMRFWLMSGNVDEERRKLALEQFAFYADELPHGSPYSKSVDTQLVQRTRRFLGAFSGEDQLYSYLLALARGSLQGVRWPDQRVINTFEVRPEFTRQGWQRADSVLGNLPSLLTRETWVAGESTVAPGDRARLAQSLRARYAQDYMTTWTSYLEAGRVPGGGSLREIAARLKPLATNPSPLIRMVGLASDHTAVDTASVRKAFAPAHAVSTPNSNAPTAAGGKYIQALAAFQANLEQVANNSGSLRDQMQLQASESARQVNNVVNEMSLSFSEPGQVQLVWSAVRSLLLLPVTNAETMLGRVSIDELNRNGGSSLCRPLRGLGGKYPFNPRSSIEATPAEVNNQLAPNTGEVWAFHENNLAQLLPRSGNRFTINASASPRPTVETREYFNNLAQISSVLFSEDGSRFEMPITVRMETSPSIPEINVRVAGQNVTTTQSNQSGRTIRWDPGPFDAQVTARVDGRLVTIASVPAGAWALFRLVAKGEVETRGPGVYRITWRNGPAAVSGSFTLEKPVGIFDARVLARVGACPSYIAR
jgi:type VI secretion system protein ImpL